MPPDRGTLGIAYKCVMNGIVPGTMTRGPGVNLTPWVLVQRRLIRRLGRHRRLRSKVKLADTTPANVPEELHICGNVPVSVRRQTPPKVLTRLSRRLRGFIGMPK